MTIELPGIVEGPLRNLAERQKRDVNTLVAEAVRQYLEAEAITDLDPSQVAEAQLALAGELQGVVPWQGGRG